MGRSRTLGRHVCVTVVGVLLLCSCRQSWEAPSQTALVVDAETKAAVPGALVVASWELYAVTGWPITYAEIPAEILQVQETVTDSDGRFVIAGWGPEVRWSRSVRMETNQPMLRILADGYCPRLLVSLSNAPLRRTGEVPLEYLPDRIELTPANGDWAKCQQAYLEVVASAYTLAYWNSDCAWTRVPRLGQRLRHDAQVGRYDQTLAPGGTIQRLPVARNCPSIEEPGYYRPKAPDPAYEAETEAAARAAAAARALTSVPPIRCDILICVKTTTLTGCFGGCAVPSHSIRPTSVGGEEVDVGIWVRGSGPEGRAGTDPRFEVLVRDFTPDGMAECSFTIDGTPLQDRTQACDSRLGQVQVTVEQQ